MKERINTKKIEEHVRGILEALGEDITREGLAQTPKRVAKMFEERFSSIGLSNDDIANMLMVTFDESDSVKTNKKDMVIVEDIEIFSFCEHHMALMYNMKVAVAYIPNGKLIGLSKVARIAEMVSKKLQLQERIGSDILYIMNKITDSKDVAVIVKGDHSCMTSRGIKKPTSKTITTHLSGAFNTDANLYKKLLLLIGD